MSEKADREAQELRDQTHLLAEEILDESFFNSEGQVRSSATRPELVGAVKQGLLVTVSHFMAKLRKLEATRDALLKENAQLRDQIAGNKRELPEGTTLEDQHREVLRMVNELAKRAVEGTLKSFAFFWEEGRAIVLHASAEPKPLIQIAQRIPS